MNQDVVSEQVTEMLNRIDSMSTVAKRKELSRELRNLPGYNLPLNANIAQIVDAVAECENGWDGLLNAIDKLPGTFNVKRRKDKELRDYLLRVRLDKDVVHRALACFQEVTATWAAKLDGWQDVYYRSAPDGELAGVSSVAEAFTSLLDSSSPYEACGFVERLALLFDVEREQIRVVSKKIATIVGVTDASLAELREQAAEETAEMRMHLLVRVDRDNAREPITAWTSWRLPIGEPVPETWRHGIRRDLRNVDVECASEIRHAVADLFECVEKEARPLGRPPIIELMVGWDEIWEPFEQWPLPGRGDVLGALAPVVVRPLVKVEQDRGRNARTRRWGKIPLSGADQVYGLGNSWPNTDLRDWIGLRVGVGDAQARLVAKGHESGFPLAIWRRRNHRDVVGLLNGHRLLSLPDLVHKHRQNHRDSDIVLMWDDPCWVPDSDILRWRTA